MAFAGADKDVYLTMQQTVVSVGVDTPYLTPTGNRVYLDEAPTSIPDNGIPAWEQPDSYGRVCVSIRPELWKLINGYYDSQLQDFLMAAPAGPPSLVALWHEASSMGATSNGPYYTYFQSLDNDFPNQGGAAGLLTQAQAYVQANAQAWQANVQVGAIEAVETSDVSALAARVNPWMAENLDFYACDTYDSSTGDADPSSMLGAWQTVCNALAGGSATIGVTETNSPFPARRPWWFTNVWSWLQSNGYTSDTTSFLTFWNPNGEESGAWISADWATIDALYAIFSQSAP